MLYDGVSEIKQLIKKKAARIVSGATKLVSIETLIEEVGWYNLSCQSKTQ